LRQVKADEKALTGEDALGALPNWQEQEQDHSFCQKPLCEDANNHDEQLETSSQPSRQIAKTAYFAGRQEVSQCSESNEAICAVPNNVAVQEDDNQRGLLIDPREKLRHPLAAKLYVQRQTA